MTWGTGHPSLTPKRAHKVTKTIHLKPHIFKSEGTLSCNNISSSEHNWKMIRSNLRKKNLMCPLKMVLPITSEQESINSRHHRNLLMARPSKTTSFQGRVNEIARINKVREVRHCRSQSSSI
uniref:Uncharacterized protein n=1 Tax=Opuntia streptacantha TaxID=393608 RepID=A0A7C9CHW8_OPUST